MALPPTPARRDRWRLKISHYQTLNLWFPGSQPEQRVGLAPTHHHQRATFCLRPSCCRDGAAEMLISCGLHSTSQMTTDRKQISTRGAGLAGPFSLLVNRRAEQPKSPTCDGLAHSPYLTRWTHVRTLFPCLSRPWEKLGSSDGGCVSAASLPGQCPRAVTAQASCAKPALTLI